MCKIIDWPRKTVLFFWVIRTLEGRRQAQGESEENPGAKGKLSEGSDAQIKERVVTVNDIE